MLVTKKAESKPAKIMIYGEVGVGKSTLGSKAEKPVFLSAEDGAEHLTTTEGSPVDEIQGIKTWEGIRTAIKALTTDGHDFKTLVIDSADWVEKICHAKIIGQSKKDIIRCNGGYGAGYRESETLHKELIADLTELRDKRGMTIIVTAHAHVKQVKDPEMAHDYDGFEIKCHDFVSSLWREWVSALLFARFNTYTNTSDGSAKARAIGDDGRTVYTVKRPAFQAKNRYGLPAEMNFTENFWEELQPYIKNGTKSETIEEVREEIAELILKVESEETKAVVLKTVEASADSIVELNRIRTRLKQIV